MEKETNDLKVANQSYENIKKSDSELLDKAITDLEKAKLAESELIAAVEKMKFDDAKESFESEIKVLSLQASEFSSDNQALKTKLKTSVDQNSASIQKLEEIRFEYAELKNKADDVVISSEASEEQYDNEITLKISEIRGLEGQIKSLAEEKESIINDQQQSIDALNDSLVSKSTELYDLKAHHENLLAESSRDLVKERVRLEETSRDLVKLKNQLAISKESSKIEIEKLESENQDLHELMLNIEEDLTESTSQSAEFKQTITDRGTGFLEITLSRTEIYLNMNKIEEGSSILFLILRATNSTPRTRQVCK
jgi:chromosome segregation ATPase